MPKGTSQLKKPGILSRTARSLPKVIAIAKQGGIPLTMRPNRGIYRPLRTSVGTLNDQIG